jgi:hypothetical protein
MVDCFLDPISVYFLDLTPRFGRGCKKAPGHKAGLFILFILFDPIYGGIDFKLFLLEAACFAVILGELR